MNQHSTSLTVSANRRNLELLTQFLSREGYQTLIPSTLERFNLAIDSLQKFKLVPVDINEFALEIWHRCEQLQKKNIPFLILSLKQTTGIQQKSLSYGRCSVLVKPIVIQELVMLVRNLTGH